MNTLLTVANVLRATGSGSGDGMCGGGRHGHGVRAYHSSQHPHGHCHARSSTNSRCPIHFVVARAEQELKGGRSSPECHFGARHRLRNLKPVPESGLQRVRHTLYSGVDRCQRDLLSVGSETDMIGFWSEQRHVPAKGCQRGAISAKEKAGSRLGRKHARKDLRV